ncbi:MAG: anaerobic ribonucleoside-triphosphate reductase activating protein [Lachnospiraceae bacterium]
MNYAQIKPCDIANGPGVRVSLFVSGCTHHCKGCFNQETWDFHYGTTFTDKVIDELIGNLSPDHIMGFSLLGGEPFEPQNQRALLPLLKRIKSELPNKSIWCYTGYLMDDELIKESRARCEVTDEILSLIDVLVDGEFQEDEKNWMLKFKGSKNQRIINVPKSLSEKKIVLEMN